MVFGLMQHQPLTSDGVRPATDRHAALEIIAHGISEWRRMATNSEGVLVSTDCLYYDRSNVAVTVVGLKNGESVVVHDGRGAEDRLAASGRHVASVDRILSRVARRYGLVAQNCKISSLPAPASDIGMLVPLVANASQEGALALLKESTRGFKRDLPSEVIKLLERRYPDASIVSDDHIEGASRRSYRFDVSLTDLAERQLLVDVVSPDANSINAAVVANIDVARRTDRRFVQAIVYDPARAEMFGASNLSLLASVALTLSLDRFTDQVETMLAA
jgi:hypothetical protein